ncbi:hypothetical protein [Streptococcus merionis]|uniref:hypothetical protein n=1 Tax=Streptococcus merionis TaxID=400065 RepID=UPI00351389D4
MFFKLVKHELKSVSKWYLTLYLMCLFLAISLGAFLREHYSVANSSYGMSYHLGLTFRENFSSGFSGILLLLVLMSFAIVVSAIAISTLSLIIKRFKDNIYGKQGYLTMTLPVSVHQLLVSKLLVSLVWVGLSLLALIVSVAVMGMVITTENLAAIFHGLAEIFQTWLSDPLFHLFQFITTTVQIAAYITLIFLSIAIGHSFENHRIITSFLAFFGLMVLVTVLHEVFMPAYTDYYAYDKQGRLIYDLLNTAFDFILMISCYFGSHYLIKNKLNLE